MATAGLLQDSSSTFESVNRNLKSYGSTISLDVDCKVTQIVYDLGSSQIVKTFNYVGDDLQSIVLSGDTPEGIDLTKTFTYPDAETIDVQYS